MSRDSYMQGRARPFARAFMLALVSFVWSAGSTFACGYEDPSSANVQRGLMNLVYPKALYVLGAVSLARTNSTLLSEPVSLPRPDLFGGAFRRAAEDLRKFGESLATPVSGDVQLSVVLLEPMFWTRYRVTAGGTSMEVHAKGPLPGKPVLVTSDVVLRYLVAGRLSWKAAEEMGLVRFYGSDSEIQTIRARLTAMW